MPDNYNMTHTGQQLDAAIEFGMSPDSTPTQNSNKGVKSGGVYTALAEKQNTLTFDNTPTQNSNNPVKSGGIYTALAGKQNTLTFDNSPTSGSNNPVKSGGVYTALAGKQDTLTFDTEPTNGSSNPVTSDGIFDAIQYTGLRRLSTLGLPITNTMATPLIPSLTIVASTSVHKGDLFFLSADSPVLCQAIRHIAAGDILKEYDVPSDPRLRPPDDDDNYIRAKQSPSTYFFKPLASVRKAKKWEESGTSRVFTMSQVGGASNVLITYGRIQTSSSSDPITSYGVYILYYSSSAWTVVPLIEGTNHPTVAINSNHTLTVTYSNVYAAYTGDCVLINLNMFPQDYV